MKLTQAHNVNLDKKYQQSFLQLAEELTEYKILARTLSKTLLECRFLMGNESDDGAEMLCDECIATDVCPFYLDSEEEFSWPQLTYNYCTYYIAKKKGLMKVMDNIKKERKRMM